MYFRVDNNPIDELFRVLKYNLELVKYVNDYNSLIGNKIMFDSLKEAIYMSDMENDFDYDILFESLSNLKNYIVIK